MQYSIDHDGSIFYQLAISFIKGRVVHQQDGTTANLAPTASKDASTINFTTKHQPRKSVEGWIIIATGIPQEAESKDIDIVRMFAEYGHIHSIHLNVDRRTGYLKGYALVEYENFKSAQEAINKLNDTEILDHQNIKVDWCHLDQK